jgi:hypothetical protein
MFYGGKFSLKTPLLGAKIWYPPFSDIISVSPDVLAGDLMGGIVTLGVLVAKVAKKVPM